MTATETPVIGRMAVIVLNRDQKCYVGNVIDTVAGANRPKRIRIQYDPWLQGRVVQPGEYRFKCWAEEE